MLAPVRSICDGQPDLAAQIHPEPAPPGSPTSTAAHSFQALDYRRQHFLRLISQSVKGVREIFCAAGSQLGEENLMAERVKTESTILRTVLVCFAISLSLPPIWAETVLSTGSGKQSQYLALGDSLAFGFNPLVQPPDLFKYIGYPTIVGGVLRLQLWNASCPGETTSTFIETSTTPSDYYPDFYCVPSKNQVFVPSNNGETQLTYFVPYHGALDQLDYATTFLKANPGTKLVTIDIGLNDVGLVQINCANTPQDCQSELTAALATVGQNLAEIFSGLRATGYQGPIIAVDAFSFNYSDPVESGAISAYNTVVEQVASSFGVTVADLYPLFEHLAAPFGGDTCAAGVLVKLPNGTCDTHPNLLGQAIIAATVIEALPHEPGE
jgi:lysophospholipase L1-like esterase